jgi:hypothetical protein
MSSTDLLPELCICLMNGLFRHFDISESMGPTHPNSVCPTLNSHWFPVQGMAPVLVPTVAQAGIPSIIPAYSLSLIPSKSKQ